MKFLWTFITAAVIAVCVAAAAMFLNINKDNEDFTFSDNVSVEGVDLSGLTYKQACEKLDKVASKYPQRFTISIHAGDRELTLTQADFRYILDYQSALDNARDYSEKAFITAKRNFNISSRADPVSVRAAVKKVAEMVDCKPVNASVKSFKPFSKKRFRFNKEKSGKSLDRVSLYNLLSSALGTGKNVKVTAIVDDIKPRLSLAKLKKRLKKLSSQTSYSYNTENGTINMSLALGSCNGSVIKAGETWSFNSCTGNSNSTANGYKKAEVIFRKKLVQGVGGGICQASTTIFRAAVLANLDIAERHNHHWASGYTYAGEDSTIDYPALDLKLKNNSDYPVFLESRLNGRTLEVNFYGIQSKKYDNVKMYSENYAILYKNSFRTKTFRVLYKKKKPVKKEVVCTSFYSLSDNHAVRPADSGTFAR